ncbi:MAG: uroporphyrinogen-III synthase [Chryseobacterium sp.]|nr:MAG: uroporphyrinogen-III synthase [Chryseobacterium sp.]
MIRILFTKELDNAEISAVLDNRFQWTCATVIQTRSIEADVDVTSGKSLIFTSVPAVHAFAKNGGGLTPQTKVYTVGEKTVKAVEKIGGSVRFNAPNAELLASELVKHDQESFIHFAGNISLPTIGNYLFEMGIPYEKVIVYNTELLTPKIDDQFDLAVFFSPSGVASYADKNEFPAQVIAIGETTAAEIRKHKASGIVVSEQNTLQDILHIIKND